MIVMCATNGPTIDCKIDERFARATNFLIYNTQDKSLKVIENNQEQAHGAGPLAVRLAIGNNVSAILSAIPGENAIKAIKTAGLAVYDAMGIRCFRGNWKAS